MKFSQDFRVQVVARRLPAPMVDKARNRTRLMLAEEERRLVYLSCTCTSAGDGTPRTIAQLGPQMK